MLLMQVVPILRAGLILMEQAATLLPVTQTYHVGYVRDDQTLEVCADSAAALLGSCSDAAAACLCACCSGA